MWIDDAELIAVLATLAGACVIVTKQGRKSYKLKKLADLERVNERTPGLPVRAFSTFTGLAPRVDGKPMLVGPYGPLFDEPVPTIRTLGFRKTGKASGEKPPPILHAKLALLGNLWWHDEADWGPEDVMGFEGKRLWVSSANFTSSSRRSIEFGYWTENPPLVQAAERFLVKLMRSIEGLDPDADSFEPDLVDVDYDDEAMREAWAESQVDAYDEDETPCDTTLDWLPDGEEHHPSFAVAVRRHADGGYGVCVAVGDSLRGNMRRVLCDRRARPTAAVSECLSWTPSRLRVTDFGAP